MQYHRYRHWPALLRCHGTFYVYGPGLGSTGTSGSVTTEWSHGRRRNVLIPYPQWLTIIHRSELAVQSSIYERAIGSLKLGLNFCSTGENLPARNSPVIVWCVPAGRLFCRLSRSNQQHQGVVSRRSAGAGRATRLQRGQQAPSQSPRGVGATPLHVQTPQAGRPASNAPGRFTAPMLPAASPAGAGRLPREA
jgi:hypothetical protein